jgi:hypothetical protein
MPSLEHCVAPGVHIPVHAAPTQACPCAVQSSIPVHCPFVSHDCTLLPEHVNEAGPQTPIHDPDTHVWSTHATGLLHCPVASHVCTPLPEHCVDPGLHTPVQAPPEHTSGQATAVPHWPVASHVCTPLPEHCADPGVHAPAQTPPEHAWFVQAVGVPNCPSAPHV